MPGLIGRILLHLWVIGFITFFGAELVHLDPTLRIVTQLLYGVPLAIWALLRLRGPRTPLDVAILAGLALYAISAALGRDPTGALATLALVVGYAALFLVVRDLGRQPEARELLSLAVATGLALTLAYNAGLLISEKVAWMAAGGGVPPLEGRLVFPWETVNVMPVLALLAVPFLAWSPRGQIRSVLIAVVALSALVVVPISVGRAGWLALIVWAVVLSAMTPSVRKAVCTPVVARSPAAVVAAGVVVVLVIATAAIVASGPVLRGLVESGRAIIWEQALVMIVDRPLLGAGPSAFSWSRLLYPPEDADLIAVRLVHNVYLQTLVDVGIIGVAAIGLPVTAWLREVARRFGALGPAERAALAALAGVATAGLLDDFSFLPAVTALVVVNAAWATAPWLHDASAARKRTHGGWHRWTVPVVLGGLLAVALPAVVREDLARAAAAEGRSDAVASRWAEAVAAFERAASAHTELAAYWLGLGQARAYEGDLEGAKVAYAHADRLNPGDPRGAAGLAALESDASARLALLERAARTTLGNPDLHIRLGVELAGEGQADVAAGAWGTAVALAPMIFPVLPYTDAGLSPHAVADGARRWIGEHPRPAPAADEAVRLAIDLTLDMLDNAAPPAWKSADALRDGDGLLAAELAQRALRDSPHDPRTYEALAAVEQRQCRRAEARSWLRLAGLLGGGGGTIPAPVAIHREFVYREASLGPTQPPGVLRAPATQPWPWDLIGLEPACPA